MMMTMVGVVVDLDQYYFQSMVRNLDSIVVVDVFDVEVASVDDCDVIDPNKWQCYFSYFSD